jgi:hypothetical protein
MSSRVRTHYATTGFEADCKIGTPRCGPRDNPARCASHGLAIKPEEGHNQAEMSGIFFDLPSVRFLRRFRILEAMLQTFAASLFRWLSAPACGLRRVHSRYDEAEFPSASQSACNKFDPALDESRATDGVPTLFGALRPCDNWKTVKDQHELLFIGKTLTPLARWGPTQRKLRTRSGTAGTGEDAEKDVLATRGRIFRKRRREKEIGDTTAQWRTAFATRAEA